MFPALRLLSLSLVALGAVAGPAPAAEASAPLQRREATPNSQGTHDGFFYYWWSDGASPANYTNLDGGSYSVEWQPGGNLLGGKGWNPGSAERSIQFSGTYEPVGNSYLTVYGWMENPRVEYYIIQNYGTYHPGSAMRRLGTATCDDGEYDIGEIVRYHPGLDPPLHQYWSIRKQKRSEGVVDTGCHFEAWRDAGLELGSQGFQIVATEGYYSSGFSEITVADVS